MGTKKVKLTPEVIRAIESALENDKRVELIPTREGIRAFLVKREGIGRIENTAPSSERG